MARDFQINGACMTLVRFGGHISVGLSNIVGHATNLSELGLSVEPVRVMPRWRHLPINIDDFGPDIPAEKIWMLSSVEIRQTLVHFDEGILDICSSESMGGGSVGGGVVAPAGTLMGGFNQYLASGYHFIGLNLSSPVLQKPWHFPAATISVGPEISLGTKRKAIPITWEAIPYPALLMVGTWQSGQEILSSGSVLWDREPDL